MQNLTFRRATESDVAGIVSLLADDGLGQSREDTATPLNDRYREAFAAVDSDPNQLLAVAVAGEELVGCLQLTFIPSLSHIGSWRGQVESVRIASPFRSKGLGHRFMDWAVDQCRVHGCGVVQLTTDRSRSDAHRFYESLGFVNSHHGMKLKL